MPDPLPARSALLVLLLCAGCAAPSSDYRTPPLDAPDAWRNGHAVQTAGTAPADWWRRLGDPLLSDLIDTALRAGLDVQSAQLRLREARARRQLASAEGAPSVSASASASRTRGSEDGTGGRVASQFGAGIDASWEPDVFGAIGRAGEAARADQERVQANLDATYVSLAAEVAVNYIQARAYQGRLAIARGNLALQAEALQLTEWRAQAGLASLLDVEQARTSLAQTQAQLPSLESGLAETRNRLAGLLGMTPGSLDARLDAPGVIPALPDEVLIGIPADTLRQRPDVRAAERTVAAESARLGVAEANRYPSFALTGSLGLDALRASDLLSLDALSGALVARVAGSLFDAGRQRQRVAIQDAVREQALIDYRRTVLGALEEVENALLALAKQRQRQATLRDAARAAGSAERLARQQYQSGLVDFQSVLSTQRSLFAVQDSLKTSEADTATALIRLYKALGGGWSGPATTASTP